MEGLVVDEGGAAEGLRAGRGKSTGKGDEEERETYEEDSLEPGVEEIVVELEGLFARRAGFGESVEQTEVGGL